MNTDGPAPDRIPLVGMRSPARVGQAIRSARRTADMTQSQLAEAARVSREVISRMENGLHAPRIGTLAAVLSALDYDIAFLPRPSRPEGTRST